MTSRYNIYVQLRQGYALANGLTGAFDLCSNEVAEAMKSGSGAALPEDVQLILKERGYLTDGTDQLQELQDYSLLMEKLDAKRHSITFIVTYQCNFRCPYCFESWRLSTKEKKWMQAVISPEMVDRIYNQIGALWGGFDKAGVALCGGEPLLPTTRESVLAILEGAKKRGITDLAVVTNGYYLDEFLELFKDFNSSFQITLDGASDVHDQRRVKADGQPTFDRIANNVTKALKAGCAVSLRTNLDQQVLASMDRFHEEESKRGWTEYDNYHPYTSRVKDPNVSEDVLPTSFEKKKRHFKELAEGGIYHLKYRYCGAEKNEWYCDPFGDAYFCMDMVGKAHLKQAEFTADGIRYVRENFDRISHRTISEMPECINCNYCFFCGGGCAAMAYDQCGDYMKPFCDMIKSDTDRAMKEVMQKYWDEHPNDSPVIPLSKSYHSLYRQLDTDDLEKLRNGKLTFSLYGQVSEFME